MSKKVGILALQGAFVEHAVMLRSLGAEAMEVRTAAQLASVNALIIPGGESTTIGKLASESGLMDMIRIRYGDGMPIWGTCAGLILLARDVGREQPLLGLMDIEVERNAFGRQTDSFETELTISSVSEVLKSQVDSKFPAVFIRAPLIRSAGAGVEVIARLDDDRIVAARQDKLLATSFHPELTEDSRFHQYFLSFLN